MPQRIVIAEHLRIAALLTDERIDELIVAQGSYQIGDIFLGTVENVLPGIDAAFVNIGESEKNGWIIDPFGNEDCAKKTQDRLNHYVSIEIGEKRTDWSSTTQGVPSAQPTPFGEIYH